jgi:hypothetical protein
MENNELENVPEAKIEKVSLKDIRREVEKQEDDELQKKFDRFMEHFNALTPEEKEQFLNRR